MNDTAVSLKNVSKFYKLYDSPKQRLVEALHPFGKKYHKEFYALNGVSLSINRGEMLGVLGKNGSGKSTLLKLVARVLVPNNGSVSVQGTISALLELGAGFNPQFTGLQNIYFYGTILGFTREQMEARIDPILEFADIGEFIHQPIKTYSSGMRARLAFAVATEVDPEILIIDEVLAVGDMRFASKCLRRMHEIKEKKKTVLFVTHDVSKVAVFCDRAVWLKDGQIAAIGDAKEISEQFRDYMMMGMVAESKPTASVVEIDNLEKRKVVQSTSAKDILSVEWVELKHLPTIKKKSVKILRAAVCKNKENRIATVFSRGERINIYLQITSDESLEDISVGWVLTDRNGLVSIHVNSNFCNSTLNYIEKGKVYTCCFNLRIPPIANGKYMISIGVKQSDKVIFKANDVFPLEIFQNDYNRLQGGYVIVEDVIFNYEIS